MEFNKGGLIRPADDRIRWNYDGMMEGLRSGRGRWEFIKTVNEELVGAGVRYLRDYASPDEIFEILEGAL
eukprot:4955986-Pyramimonas_sp.AAC.1